MLLNLLKEAVIINIYALFVSKVFSLFAVVHRLVRIYFSFLIFIKVMIVLLRLPLHKIQ